MERNGPRPDAACGGDASTSEYMAPCHGRRQMGVRPRPVPYLPPQVAQTRWGLVCPVCVWRLQGHREPLRASTNYARSVKGLVAVRRSCPRVYGRVWGPGHTHSAQNRCRRAWLGPAPVRGPGPGGGRAMEYLPLVVDVVARGLSVQNAVRPVERGDGLVSVAFGGLGPGAHQLHLGHAHARKAVLGRGRAAVVGVRSLCLQTGVRGARRGWARGTADRERARETAVDRVNDSVVQLDSGGVVSHV